jgi:hypothetical protein
MIATSRVIDVDIHAGAAVVKKRRFAKGHLRLKCTDRSFPDGMVSNED